MTQRAQIDKEANQRKDAVRYFVFTLLYSSFCFAQGALVRLPVFQNVFMISPVDMRLVQYFASFNGAETSEISGQLKSAFERAGLPPDLLNELDLNLLTSTSLANPWLDSKAVLLKLMDPVLRQGLLALEGQIPSLPKVPVPQEVLLTELLENSLLSPDRFLSFFQETYFGNLLILTILENYLVQNFIVEPTLVQTVSSFLKTLETKCSKLIQKISFPNNPQNLKEGSENQREKLQFLLQKVKATQRRIPEKVCREGIESQVSVEQALGVLKLHLNKRMDPTGAALSKPLVVVKGSQDLVGEFFNQMSFLSLPRQTLVVTVSFSAPFSAEELPRMILDRVREVLSLEPTDFPISSENFVEGMEKLDFQLGKILEGKKVLVLVPETPELFFQFERRGGKRKNFRINQFGMSFLGGGVMPLKNLQIVLGIPNPSTEVNLAIKKAQTDGTVIPIQMMSSF